MVPVARGDDGMEARGRAGRVGTTAEEHVRTAPEEGENDEREARLENRILELFTFLFNFFSL
jgi:hypothetical protein